MAPRIETGQIDIDAIKDQYPLADEVRRHLSLKPRGTTLVGLCPFHMERTPSFTVYPQEARFHCFGCDAHGDIFDFLHRQSGLDIRAAAERLTGGMLTETDRWDNKWLSKQRAINKIDAAVALCMAVGAAMAGDSSGTIDDWLKSLA